MKVAAFQDAGWILSDKEQNRRPYYVFTDDSNPPMSKMKMDETIADGIITNGSSRKLKNETLEQVTTLCRSR